MAKQEDEAFWREAHRRLRTLDAEWDAAVCDVRQRQVEACREWLAQQKEVPRLAALARLLVPGMTRRQLWSVLVPVERSVARSKVTDIEILDTDQADGTPRGSRFPLTVVADSIRSAFNVGGLFRTAECFGVSEIILCGYTPEPTQEQVMRAALGAESLVPWRYEEDVRRALSGLKGAGIYCVGMETVEGAAVLEETEWPFPCAMVLGNERFGLDADVLALCDSFVRIPLYGCKNSLNVVSAFAIAAHTVRKRFDQSEGAVAASLPEANAQVRL